MTNVSRPLVGRKRAFISRLRDALQASNDPFWTDERMREYIYYAEMRLAQETRGFHNVQTIEVSATNGRVYDIPGDCMYVTDVVWSGTKLIQVPESYTFSTSYPTGRGYAYAIQEPVRNKILLYPEPTYTANINVHYVRRPPRAGIRVWGIAATGCTSMTVHTEGGAPTATGFEIANKVFVTIVGGTNAGNYTFTNNFYLVTLGNVCGYANSIWSNTINVHFQVSADANKDDYLMRLEMDDGGFINIKNTTARIDYEFNFPPEWEEAVFDYCAYICRLKDNELDKANHHLAMFNAKLPALKKSAERIRHFDNPPRMVDISSTDISGYPVWTGLTMFPYP